MAKISRSSILYAIVIAVLLASVPGAIRKIVQTGDPYLFTERFFQDILARLSGPGRLRFIMQPAVAVFLGVRSGMKDAQAGFAPFLWAVIFHRRRRRELLRSSLASMRDLIAIAILLDLISQFLIFREIRPGAALLVGPVLITLPYVLARTLSNRIVRKRSHLTPTAHVS
jgi:drug/metabolite transporter (DMT)-like permease